MTKLYLTREQSRLVDQIAIQQFGMTGLVLMENAGRGCADKLCQLGIRGPVVICCGKGNNAGDGFVIARHLDLRGYEVRVLLWCLPSELQGDAAANFAILERAQISVRICCPGDPPDWLSHQVTGADWVIDALLGTGSRGQPRPPLDSVINSLNQLSARRLAVDLPSGLDCDSGHTSESTFRADHTCTFVASKIGFRSESAQSYLGQVHVLDIGAPRRLVDRLSQKS